MEKSLNILRALVAVLKGGHLFVDTFAIERRDSVPSSGIWIVLVTFNPSSLVTVNTMRLPRLDHKKSQFPPWLQVTGTLSPNALRGHVRSLITLNHTAKEDTGRHSNEQSLQSPAFQPFSQM